MDHPFINNMTLQCMLNNGLRSMLANGTRQNMYVIIIQKQKTVYRSSHTYFVSLDSDDDNPEAYSSNMFLL